MQQHQQHQRPPLSPAGPVTGGSVGPASRKSLRPMCLRWWWWWRRRTLSACLPSLARCELASRRGWAPLGLTSHYARVESYDRVCIGPCVVKFRSDLHWAYPQAGVYTCLSGVLSIDTETEESIWFRMWCEVSVHVFERVTTDVCLWRRDLELLRYQPTKRKHDWLSPQTQKLGEESYTIDSQGDST